MKKVLVLLAMVMLFTFTGCPKALTDFLATDAGALVASQAAELAGMVIGFENQDDVVKIVDYCDTLLKEKEETLKQAAMEAGAEYIYSKYGHNLQTALFVKKAFDLIGIVVIDGKLNFLEEYDLALLDKFILDFRNGVSLASPRHKKLIR